MQALSSTAGRWNVYTFPNSRPLLVIDDLQEAGFEVLVIGGWAEELQGLAEPRTHEDIDVVLQNPASEALDAFVGRRTEVVEKRFSQKRAYRATGVLVEVFLAMAIGRRYQTIWWERFAWGWETEILVTFEHELFIEIPKALPVGYPETPPVPRDMRQTSSREVRRSRRSIWATPRRVEPLASDQRRIRVGGELAPFLRQLALPQPHAPSRSS